MAHIRRNRFGWIYYSNFVEMDVEEISKKKLIYANVSKHVEKKLEKSNKLTMVRNFADGIKLIHNDFVSDMIKSCYNYLSYNEKITSANYYLEKNMISDKEKLGPYDLIALSTWNKDFQLTKDLIHDRMKLLFTTMECLDNIGKKSGRVGIVVPKIKANRTYSNRVDEELFNLVGYIVKFSGKNTCCLHLGNEFYSDVEDVICQDDSIEIISISDSGNTDEKESRLKLWDEFDSEQQVFRRLDNIHFTKFKRIIIVLNFQDNKSWINNYFDFFKKIKNNLKLFEVVFIAVGSYNSKFIEDSMLGYWDGTILTKSDLNL